MQLDLAFDAEAHEYKLSGVRIPSVTQVLSFGQDLSRIPRWTAERGTAFHLATEYDDEGDLDEESVDALVRPHLTAYQTWKRGQNPRYLNTEFKVWGEIDGRKFAGTIDRVLRTSRELLEVWDLKSGSPRKEHGAQVAAYKLAYEQRTNQSVDRIACLYCQKDGAPLPKYYPADECLGEFRKALFRWWDAQ